MSLLVFHLDGKEHRLFYTRVHSRLLFSERKQDVSRSDKDDGTEFTIEDEYQCKIYSLATDAANRVTKLPN